MRTRAIQAKLLAWPTARTIRWLPILVSAAAGFLIVYGGLLSKGGVGFLRAHHGLSDAALHLPIAAVVLCLSVAFVLDDAAAETVGGVPTPLLLRRGIRIAAGLPLLAALWAGIVAYAGFRPIVGAMWVLFAGMLALTLALAAVGARFLGEERAGMFASPCLLVLLVASGFVSERWRPFPLVPISPRGFELYARWTIALAVSIAVFVLASLDPARPSRVRRIVVRTLRRRDVLARTAPEQPEEVAS